MSAPDASGPVPAGSVSGESLATAVANGLLTQEQVDALRHLERGRKVSAQTEPADDERFRFITGFGDIFVAIGLGLFLGALSYLAGAIVGSAVASGIAVAAASWLLAEYFTRKSRMALPSILLLVVYAVSIFFSVAEILNGRAYPILIVFWGYSGWPAVIAGLVTAGATALHYLRFRVPVTIAAGVAALVAALVSLLFALAPSLAQHAFMPLTFLCGLAVFALAMRFDLSDPARLTRRTDIAFWLHMLAAPLIVHPLVSGLFNDGEMGTGAAFGILAIFLVLALIALIVDRRAILVSGLSYAGFAFGSLIMKTGLNDTAVPLTLLVLGALVLLLSAGWHALRRALLPLLPGALVRRLSPHT